MTCLLCQTSAGAHRLYVRDKNIYKSQVKENNHHPVWNEEFKFLVHEPHYQVRCWAWSSLEHALCSMFPRFACEMTRPGLCPADVQAGLCPAWAFRERDQTPASHQAS